MHPYRLLPHVLGQAQTLKKKPSLQAILEFSSFTTYLFLYHLSENDDKMSRHFLIALSHLAYFKAQNKHVIKMVEKAEIDYHSQVNHMARDKKNKLSSNFFSSVERVKHIQQTLEECREQLLEQYSELPTQESLQLLPMYERHYEKIHVFCSYLMLKALQIHSVSEFNHYLRSELQKFVLEEFGSVPWTFWEVFQCILICFSCLVLILAALLLVPQITTFVAQYFLLDASVLLISGVCGILSGSYLLGIGIMMQTEEDLKNIGL